MPDSEGPGIFIFSLQRTAFEFDKVVPPSLGVSYRRQSNAVSILTVGHRSSTNADSPAGWGATKACTEQPVTQPGKEVGEGTGFRLTNHKSSGHELGVVHPWNLQEHAAPPHGLRGAGWEAQSPCPSSALDQELRHCQDRAWHPCVWMDGSRGTAGGSSAGRKGCV